MGERRPCKAEVVGSIPISSTLRAGCTMFNESAEYRGTNPQREVLEEEFFDNCIRVTGSMRARLVAMT